MRTLVAVLIMMAGVAPALGEPAPDVIALTNAFRAENGLGPLRASPLLEAAAEAHGRDMAEQDFFSHTGSDGSNLGQRAKRQGFRYCLIAENIAWGQRSPQSAMQAWIGSDGHRRNLLQPKAREIGVIRHQPGDIWVMVVGTRMGRC